MSTTASHPELQKQAKFVGFTYLTTTLIGFINNFLVKPGTNIETLLQSEFQFRLSELLDIVMFALVLWMAVALYLLSKSINKNRALIGFVFRAAEVAVGFVIVLISLAPLIILKRAENFQLDHETLHSFASAFAYIAGMGWNLHLILMSIGAIVFMWLLLSASYIPKWLGYWGLLTYVTVLLGFSLQILIPDFPRNLMMVMAPGALFELVFGIWLLVKGVNLAGARLQRVP